MIASSRATSPAADASAGTTTPRSTAARFNFSFFPGLLSLVPAALSARTQRAERAVAGTAGRVRPPQPQHCEYQHGIRDAGHLQGEAAREKTRKGQRLPGTRQARRWGECRVQRVRCPPDF